MSHTAPGWYQTADGITRWWDGSAWTAVAPVAQTQQQSNERNLALLAHLGPLLGLSVIAPAIVLYKANEGQPSPWLRHHAVESLNFNLAFLLAYFGLFFLTFVIAIVTLGFGLFVMVPVLMAMVVGSIIMSIIATVAASKGEWYRYPVTIRFIK